MPRKKKAESEAEPDGKPEPKLVYKCKKCIEMGIPEEQATFNNWGTYGRHLQEHRNAEESSAAATEQDPDAAEKLRLENQQDVAVKALIKKQSLMDRATRMPLDEMDVLREILDNAGVIARRESVINTFNESHPDDISSLDGLLKAAAVPFAARKMVLLNWMTHRGLPHASNDYIQKTYIDGPSQTTVRTETAESKAAAEAAKEPDPLDSMMKMMDKQLKMMSMQMQMSYMQKMMATGGMAIPDGMKPIEAPKEEPKLRLLEGGVQLKMTDSEYNEHVLTQQRFKQQMEFEAAKNDRKKDVEKLPIRMDDGTVVQVPADQVDKWLLILKSTSPENKKDIYELIREQEKTRQEMERFYQQQMVQLKDQNYQMAMEQQQRVIQQLQAQMAQRPSPIQEMVQTQTELKEAGLLAEKSGKDVDTSRLEMQEKKLDTTMQMMLQQQQSLTRKTDQLVSALGPMMQKYAMQAADNLPQPQQIREQMHQTRVNVAREILPTDVSTIERIAQMDGAEEAPKPRRKKVVGVQEKAEE